MEYGTMYISVLSPLKDIVRGFGKDPCLCTSCYFYYLTPDIDPCIFRKKYAITKCRWRKRVAKNFILTHEVFRLRKLGLCEEEAKDLLREFAGVNP